MLTLILLYIILLLFCFCFFLSFRLELLFSVFLIQLSIPFFHIYLCWLGYLEISQRVTLLNQRAEVISDLLDMLSEHTTSKKLTYQTWIIIVLIIIAICIAIAEVAVKALKFREKRGGKINMYNNII